MDLLRSEFNLMAHIRVVQQYFLMEAGAIMHQFTHELFQRVSQSDITTCNMQVHACT